MSLDRFAEKLEGYVRKVKEKAGKVRKLNVTWSDGSFWCRVHNLGWDDGKNAHPWEDSLGVEVEPRKALKAIRKKHPQFDEFFVEGGNDALEGDDEFPPGEYGLWLMAIVDERIAEVEARLRPALEGVKLSIGGHDGAGPWSFDHYLDEVEERRQESGCVPSPAFLRAVLGAFTSDQRRLARWLAHAPVGKPAPAPRAWREYFLGKVRRKEVAKSLRIELDGKDVRQFDTTGGTYQVLDWKLKTPELARAKAEELVRQHLADGYAGDPDETRAEFRLWRSAEGVFPVKAVLYAEASGKALDITPTFERWLFDGTAEQVRAARALIPDLSMLEHGAGFLYQSWGSSASVETDDEPLHLNRAKAELVAALVKEARKTQKPVKPGEAAWGWRMRIKAGSKAPRWVEWRLEKGAARP